MKAAPVANTWLRCLPPAAWLLAGFQIILAIGLQTQPDMFRGGRWTDRAATTAASLLSAWLLGCVLGQLPNHWPIVKALTVIGLATAQLAALIYQLRANVILSYALLKDCWATLVLPEAWAVLASRFTTADYLILLAFYFAAIISERKWNCFSNQTQRPAHLGKAAFIAYTLLLIASSRSREPLHTLLRSALLTPKPLHRTTPATEGYPYISTNQPGRLKTDQKPDIFLLVIESFNRNFVGTRTPEGKEYTPIFNALSKKGTVIDRFYANSVYTIKGHETILTGILPTIHGSLPESFPKTTLQGLPTVLHRYGYQTYYFQAQPSITFGFTDRLMQRVGFDQIHALDEHWLTHDENQQRWGWGARDIQLYQKALNYLTQTGQTNEQPVFAMFATVANHAPFDQVPPALRFLYPTPNSKRQCYANSLALTDHDLGDFLERLKAHPRFRKAHLILTGDHSFPIGEHDGYCNEASAYEEDFRTPLLIVGPNIPATNITTTSYDQTDIAPTLLDIANIQCRHHFVGQSVFAVTPRHKAHQLLQPYGGTLLCAIDFPYKYIYQQQTGREAIFDLENDPHEDRNIIGTTSLNTLKNLQNEAAKLETNEQLIERNRIWKEAP